MPTADRIGRQGDGTGSILSIITSDETGDRQRAFRWLVHPFAYAVRSHRGIENKLYWSLDVTFMWD
jgi:hypothetical protein